MSLEVLLQHSIQTSGSWHSLFTLFDTFLSTAFPETHNKIRIKINISKSFDNYCMIDIDQSKTPHLCLYFPQILCCEKNNSISKRWMFYHSCILMTIMILQFFLLLWSLFTYNKGEESWWFLILRLDVKMINCDKSSLSVSYCHMKGWKKLQRTMMSDVNSVSQNLYAIRFHYCITIRW